MREGYKCVEAVEAVEVLGDSVYGLSLPWLPLCGRARARNAKKARESAPLAEVRGGKAGIMMVWMPGDWGSLSVSRVKLQFWGGSNGWPYTYSTLSWVDD